MRLITRIILVFLIITLAVFAVGGVMSYFIIKREIDAEHQRFLSRRIDRAAELVRQGASLQSYDGEKLEVIPLAKGTPPSDDYIFSDTMVWHPYLQRLEPHYKVSSVRLINDHPYYLETFDVIVETDDITEAVIESLSRIYIILLLAFAVLGTLASTVIFRPFNDTLNKIRTFRVGGRDPLDLRATSIREFSRLNRFVREMAQRSRREYQALKEFSENASHELQTPISVAKGYLERIMESPRLNEEDMRLVDSAQQSLQRLSRLGHSLSLLTRIDNEEFANNEWIDLGAVVKGLLPAFRELAEIKGLSFQTEVEDEVFLRIDPTLAEILVSNLLQNAIRHNLPNGYIEVELNRDRLRVANSGPPPEVAPAELFRRFRKGNQSSSSLGLGLAIVKRICEQNQLMIHYDYAEEQHAVTLHFPARPA